MGWIDIAVIAIIVISAIVGLAKGLFESILSLFGTALSLFVAIWASKPVAGFINGIVDMNAFFAKLLTDWGVADGGEINILIYRFTLEQAAEFASILASVIVVFILIKLVIWMLAKLFDSATQNSSALSGLNRLLGLVFGTAKGLVFVAIALAATSLVSSFAFGSQIQAEIEKNQITSFIYGYVDNFVDDTLEDQLRQLIGDPVEEEEEEVITTSPNNQPVVIVEA